MKNVFISYKFTDPEDPVVGQVRQLVDSHDLKPTDGRYLDGGDIDDEVGKLLGEADALIALFLLPKPPDADFSWLIKEFTAAGVQRKPCIAVFEKDFEPYKAFASKMHLRLDRANPLSTFLNLSTTLGNWKKAAGRRVSLRVQPEGLAQVMEADKAIPCRYRLSNRTAGVAKVTETAWCPAQLYGSDQGVLFNADGVQDGNLIDIEAQVGGVRYACRGVHQIIPVQLEAQKS